MSTVRIQLGNSLYLDTSKNLPVPLTYNIDDVKDPTKRNSSHSKTVVLPGTKNNNKVFGNLFQMNADFTFFNPNIKIPAKIIVDSTVVLDGFLQLRKIKILENQDSEGNLIQYDVFIFDKTVNFFNEIADKELTDLDFSDYNHTYNFTNVQSSWSHTSDDVYGYPMLFNNSNDYSTTDFKPGIFHKAYLKKIAEDAGFSLGGSFMEHTDYEREIIPYNGELVAVSSIELDRREFRAGVPTGSTVSLFDTTLIGGLINNNQALISKADAPFLGYTDDTTSPNFDTNGHWDTTTNTYTTDRNGSYNVDLKLYVDVEFKTQRSDIINITGTSSYILITFADEHNFTPGSFLANELTGTINYDGDYTGAFVYDPNSMGPKTIKLTGVIYVGDESGSGATFSWDAYQSTYRVNSFFMNPYETNLTTNGNYTYEMSVQLRKDGTYLIGAGSQKINVPRSSVFASNLDPAFSSTNDYKVTQPLSISLSKVNMGLLNGDNIDISYMIRGNSTTSTFLKYGDRAHLSTAKPVPVLVSFKLLYSETASGDLSTIFNSANNSDVQDGDPINLNNYLPKKQMQQNIIIDLIKRYNLYISIDPDNDKKILLDTRDAFYEGGNGKILDWTNKKDFSDKNEIKLLSELQKKEILFTYKTDKDGLNTTYKETFDNDIYGQKTIEFVNEFIEGEKKVETPFSPTPLRYDNENSRGKIVSSISTTAPRNNIRVLYYSGLINTLNNSSWNFRHIDSGVVVNTSFTEYPYAGHFSHPLTPDSDLNFGELTYLFYSEGTRLTNNTMYQRYWSNYINQISEGKLVTSKFYLTEVDIAFIKNNFNSKIFIKDSYFFVNKIVDFNPLTNGTTKVELIKINDGVPFVEETTTPVVVLTTVDIRTKSGGGGGVDVSIDEYETTNTTQSDRTIISGENNYIGENSEDVIIIGSDNIIEADSSESGIIGGSDNLIEPGVENGWIIGTNNKTITQPNEIWIGEVHIIDGKIVSNINRIVGGVDELKPLFGTPISPENRIVGGVDELRDVNYTNNINRIKGSIDSL